jgi:hypothetical protein
VNTYEKIAYQQAQEEMRLARQVAQDNRETARRAARQARRDAVRQRGAAAHPRWRAFWRKGAPALGAAVPVVMVNATAFIGQFFFIRAHVPWVLLGQVLVAVTFESVAVYLAWQAHRAALANDTSARIKMGAYLFAVVMGCMNYSHYAAAHLHPTFMSVGMFLMSAISPWLWGIHTRRVSRDALMERGLVEGHAVRLGTNRVFWHPWRAVAVMSQAAWDGETDPKRAIGTYETRHAARQVARDTRRAAHQEGRRTAVPAVVQVPVPAVAQVPSQGGAPVAQLPVAPAGPVAPLPGTQVNGTTVLAIATLKAKPRMGVHEIPASTLAEWAQHLAQLGLDSLPSERELAKLICDKHDHRRQASPLLKARKAGPAEPPVRLVGRQGAPTQFIATPAANVPGGNQNHG